MIDAICKEDVDPMPPKYPFRQAEDESASKRTRQI
jgi:hypothetical protein